MCNTARYTAVGNRHRESKNTKLYKIGSGTKLLFVFLSLKVFRHEEREREREKERERKKERLNLSMLTAFASSVLDPTNARRL